MRPGDRRLEAGAAEGGRTPWPQLTAFANVFHDLPSAGPDEVFTELLAYARARIERIVSTGQATPEDAPYDTAPVIRRTDDGIEFVQLRWGFPPARPKGRGHQGPLGGAALPERRASARRSGSRSARIV